MSKPECLISPSALLTIFPNSVDGNFILPVAQPQNFGLFCCFLFLTYLILSLSADAVGFSFKMCPEADYFTPSPLPDAGHPYIPPGFNNFLRVQSFLGPPFLHLKHNNCQSDSAKT